MWEIATLGNIPTSTYFFAGVAFSLGREGGTDQCVFVPFSSCFSPLTSPTARTALGTVRLLGLHLA